MGYHKRKKTKAPHFVMVRKDMLKDPEWQKLSNSAKILWIYMRAKFNNQTLNKVTLAYSEMNNVMASATLSNSFKELIKKEWIKKEKQGGLYGGVTTYTFCGPYAPFYYKNGQYVL